MMYKYKINAPKMHQIEAYLAFLAVLKICNSRKVNGIIDVDYVLGLSFLNIFLKTVTLPYKNHEGDAK